MIKLNLLDQPTYNSLRLQLLQNVEEKKNRKGEAIFSKTVYFDGGKEGVGNPTIGIGMNLRDGAVRKSFAKFILKRYSVTDSSIIDSISRKIETAVSSGSSFNTVETLQAELDRIIKDQTGNPLATSSFSTDQEVEDAFVGLADDIYEKRVNNKAAKQGITIDLSYERLALLSLSYNGGLGDKLMMAIKDGNRPEAWYQIRYATNSAVSVNKKTGVKTPISQSIRNGLSKRRYYESQIFGLYDSPNGVVTLEESKAILAMHDGHAERIQSYDEEFGGYVSNANRDYGSVALNGVTKTQNLRESLYRAQHTVLDNYLSSEQIKQINQISFASSSLSGVATGSVKSSDPLVVPYKVKAPDIQLQSLAQRDAKPLSRDIAIEEIEEAAELEDDYYETTDDTALSSFDDDTAYYSFDDDYTNQEVQRVNSLLIGESPTDTFQILSISGQDYIVSVVSDGTIKIGNKVISGSIPPKTDSSGNKLDNVWTYESFDFYRVSSVDGGVSSDGDSLVIVKSGEKYSASSSNKVTIPNFPFEKDKAFGFSLGKSQDLELNTNGEYVSVTGYDVSVIDGDYRVNGGTMVKTSDNKKFFTVIRDQISPGNYFCSKVIFSSDGKEVSRENLHDDFVGIYDSSVLPFYFFKQVDGSSLTVIPYSFAYSDEGTTNVHYSKVGFCVLDKDGKMLFSSIVAAGNRNLGSGQVRSVFGSQISVGDSDYFYVTYTSWNGKSSIMSQKINRETFEMVGDAVLYNGELHGKLVNKYLPVVDLIFADGNKASGSTSKVVIYTPKYREYLASEISPNFNVDGGTYKTDSSLKSMVVSLSSDADADLLISPNPDSNLVIIGRDSESMLSSSLQSESQFKSRINLPILDISEADVFALDASKVSLSELVGGSYDKSLLVNVRQQQMEGGRRLVEGGSNSTDDGYYYDGEYYYDAVDDTIPALQNATHTVLIIRDSNQAVSFYGANATDIFLQSSKYFSTLGDIENFPTQLPTSTPSEKEEYPSSLPSGFPSSNPSSSLPSSNPSGFPSSLPSSDPTYYHPSSRPSASPTGVKYPSSLPTKNSFSPSLEPTIEETDSPTFEPSEREEENSEFPSSSPSEEKYPSSNPSELPSSSNPTNDPTYYHPSSRPSVSPTGVKYPSSLPTKNSFLPSLEPTIEETDLPTFEPSEREEENSEFPSSSPSEEIDNITSNPSGFPSVAPSEKKTPTPTLRSKDDSDLPSSRPSYLRPSSEPTKKTFVPSNVGEVIMPSSNPSFKPFKESEMPTIKGGSSISPTVEAKETIEPTSEFKKTWQPSLVIDGSSNPTNYKTIYPTLDSSNNNPERPSNIIVPVAASVGSIAFVGLVTAAVYKFCTRKGTKPSANKVYADIVGNEGGGEIGGR